VSATTTTLPAPPPCTSAECSDGLITTRDDQGRCYVERCPCYAVRKLYEFRGRRGFPLYPVPPTLADFEPGWGAKRAGRTEQSRAAYLGGRWLDSYARGVGAYVWGRTGSGKTRFATALANDLCLRGGHMPMMVCLQTDIPETGYSATEWWKLRAQIQKAKILIVDNLRADLSDYRTGQCAKLVEEFTRSRRSVLFTSTLDPRQLQGSGAWGDVASRIGELCGRWQICLGAEDFRKPDSERRAPAPRKPPSGRDRAANQGHDD